MKTAILLLFAAASAFAQKIEIESDQNVNFAKFRTFAVGVGRLNSRNPSINNDLIRKRLDADIVNALSAKGLAFVAHGPADLYVQYILGAARDIQREVYPAGWRGWGTRVVRVPYTEGTLVTDLRESGTRSLVWRAIAREDQSNPSKVESKLDNMVKKSFAKYPPKAK